MKNSNEISKDSVFNGELTCFQHKEGYRFSIDSILLAHFALHWKSATILDLGCGCGILSLILLYRNYENINNIEGIEYQEKLVQLARMNLHANNYEEKLKITHGDYVQIKNYYQAETFSHIICNPPFYAVGSGRPSMHSEAFLARHQAVSTTTDLARSIAYVLKNKGNLAIVYPAELTAKLMSTLKETNLEPKRLQPIYSYPDSPAASLILLECKKNGGVGLKFLPPLYIYTQQNGDYSDEIKKMYQPCPSYTEDKR